MIDIAEAAGALLKGGSVELSIEGLLHPVCMTPGSSFTESEPVIHVYTTRRTAFRITGFYSVRPIALAACLYRPDECRALAQTLNLLLEAMLGTLSENRACRGYEAAPCRNLTRAVALLEDCYD